MSYDHIRAVAKRFNGTLAERMVLTCFATHSDPKTGISTVSLDGVAAFTHIDRSNVRRIVRKLEGSQDAEMPEPGLWLYPLGKRAMPGDAQRTCYRMFLDSFTAPAKRAPRNPSGFNTRGGRVPVTPGMGGVPVTPQGVTETGVHGGVPVTPEEVTQSPEEGYRKPPRGVTVTGKSIESLKAPRSIDWKGYTDHLKEMMRIGGNPLTQVEWSKRGQAPTPPEDLHRVATSAGREQPATSGPGHLPAGARQLTIPDDLNEPTYIPELQT